MGELNCSGSMGKLFLVVVNLIFILLGLGLMIPGILIQLDIGIITDTITPLLNQISFGGMSLGNAINTLSAILIAIGAFILILATIGMCGACYKNRVYLMVYAIIVIIFWLIEVVIVILWIVMKDDLEKEFKTQLVSQLQNNYQYDDMTTDTLSKSFNYLFIQMSCCAVNGVTGTTNDFDSSIWVTSGNSGSQNIPKACCGATVTTYASYTNTACTNTVTSGYYATGCYDAAYNAIMMYSSIFIAIGVTVLVTETIAIIAAFCICTQVGKKQTSVRSMKD